MAEARPGPVMCLSAKSLRGWRGKLSVPATRQIEADLEIGGREGIRTLDLSVANAALSQLSYAPGD